MNRRLPLLLLALATSLASPTVSGAATCTDDLPVSDRRAASVTCTGVHPGMGLIIPSQKWGDYECAAGFAFADQYGQRYLTFPGSCFLDYDCLEDTVYEQLPPPLNELVPRVPTCLLPSDSELEPAYKRGGPPVKDFDGKRIGAIVYAVNKNDVDFALVRLDAGVRMDPAMPVYGGPVRWGAAPSSVTEAYAFSVGMLPYHPNATTGYAQGGPDFPSLVTSRWGTLTAGTPVMKTDGTAIGYLDGYLSLDGYQMKPLGPALDRASRRTGLKLRIMTAKLTT